MVFYFTGTGNSLYVAKQIEEVPLSIPQVMRTGNSEFTSESIGIVAPIYGHELPSMVKEFMKKSIFHTDYFYIILTYGNRHGGAAELANCQTCLACAHACPQKAVQLTIPEVNSDARYHNEHISLQEIMEANCQIS